MSFKWEEIGQGRILAGGYLEVNDLPGGLMSLTLTSS